MTGRGLTVETTTRGVMAESTQAESLIETPQHLACIAVVECRAGVQAGVDEG